MLVPKWFEEEYGRDKACSGWYVEINNGDYKLLPYWIHPKTREAQKHDESMKSNKEEQKENIVSKTASQVGMS
jgi:predicted GIY-YIG superfamily endonuclease